MADDLNRLALIAKHDDGVREKLIQDNTKVILRSASSALGRYVTTDDDEWSVALYAFSQAIDRYSDEKGDFLPFAQMVMKRSVIDYWRTQSKYSNETSVAPEIMEGNADEEEDNDVYFAIVEQSEAASERTIAEEISAANEMLSEFGFSFYDLTACSPKQDKTRNECAVAIRYMIGQEILVRQMYSTGKLPIKEIRTHTRVSGKTLDKYRKYLIAAIVILYEDFPQLAEYLKYVKRGS